LKVDPDFDSLRRSEITGVVSTSDYLDRKAVAIAAAETTPE
jgi:hypothetical protein